MTSKFPNFLIGNKKNANINISNSNILSSNNTNPNSFNGNKSIKLSA